MINFVSIILTVIVKIIFLFLMWFILIFIWILKLIPLWFILNFFSYVFWENFVNFIFNTSTTFWWFFWLILSIIIFLFFIILIFFLSYLLIIWIVNLLFNLNFFSNFKNKLKQNQIDENQNDIEEKIRNDISLKIEDIKYEIFEYLKKYTVENNVDLTEFWMIKKSFLLLIIFFQIWLIKTKKLIDFFLENFKSKWYITIILWFFIFIFYLIFLKSSYFLNINNQNVEIKNWYDFVKVISNWLLKKIAFEKVFWNTVTFFKNVLWSKIVYKENSSKIIWNLYEYFWLLKLNNVNFVPVYWRKENNNLNITWINNVELTTWNYKILTWNNESFQVDNLNEIYINTIWNNWILVSDLWTKLNWIDLENIDYKLINKSKLTVILNDWINQFLKLDNLLEWNNYFNFWNIIWGDNYSYLINNYNEILKQKNKYKFNTSLVWFKNYINQIEKSSNWKIKTEYFNNLHNDLIVRLRYNDFKTLLKLLNENFEIYKKTNKIADLQNMKKNSNKIKNINITNFTLPNFLLTFNEKEEKNKYINNEMNDYYKFADKLNKNLYKFNFNQINLWFIIRKWRNYVDLDYNLYKNYLNNFNNFYDWNDLTLFKLIYSNELLKYDYWIWNLYLNYLLTIKWKVFNNKLEYTLNSTLSTNKNEEITLNWNIIKIKNINYQNFYKDFINNLKERYINKNWSIHWFNLFLFNIFNKLNIYLYDFSNDNTIKFEDFDKKYFQNKNNNITHKFLINLFMFKDFNQLFDNENKISFILWIYKYFWNYITKINNDVIKNWNYKNKKFINLISIKYNNRLWKNYIKNFICNKNNWWSILMCNNWNILENIKFNNLDNWLYWETNWYLNTIYKIPWIFSLLQWNNNINKKTKNTKIIWYKFVKLNLNNWKLENVNVSLFFIPIIETWVKVIDNILFFFYIILFVILILFYLIITWILQYILYIINYLKLKKSNPDLIDKNELYYETIWFIIRLFIWYLFIKLYFFLMIY